MTKVIVLSFITLDGVMQAPGGPEEDPSNDFKYGGWSHPYFDDFAGKVMAEQMAGNYALLLGRKTFEIFAGYWPEHTDEWPTINSMTKYVASNTLKEHSWENTQFLDGDVAEKIKVLKESDGPDLQVHGSGELIQTLLKNDLIDELWLKIFPVTLGTGKKLFADGTIPKTFELTDSKVSPKGVIFANFKKGGEVKTGSF
jgi:dihydrofolate reductase